MLRKYHPGCQKARCKYRPKDPNFDPETQKSTQLYVLHRIGGGEYEQANKKLSYDSTEVPVNAG